MHVAIMHTVTDMGTRSHTCTTLYMYRKYFTELMAGRSIGRHTDVKTRSHITSTILFICITSVLCTYMYEQSIWKQSLYVPIHTNTQHTMYTHTRYMHILVCDIAVQPSNRAMMWCIYAGHIRIYIYYTIQYIACMHMLVYLCVWHSQSEEITEGKSRSTINRRLTKRRPAGDETYIFCMFVLAVLLFFVFVWFLFFMMCVVALLLLLVVSSYMRRKTSMLYI